MPSRCAARRIGRPPAAWADSPGLAPAAAAAAAAAGSSLAYVAVVVVVVVLVLRARCAWSHPASSRDLTLCLTLARFSLSDTRTRRHCRSSVCVRVLFLYVCAFLPGARLPLRLPFASATSISPSRLAHLAPPTAVDIPAPLRNTASRQARRVCSSGRSTAPPPIHTHNLPHHTRELTTEPTASFVNSFPKTKKSHWPARATPAEHHCAIVRPSRCF